MIKEWVSTPYWTVADQFLLTFALAMVVFICILVANSR